KCDRGSFSFSSYQFESAQLSDGPSLRENALEVAAQNSFDTTITVLTANQALRKVEHPLWMIYPFNIYLLPESITSLVARCKRLVELGRHVVVTVEIDVAADSEMLDAHQLCYVVVMIQIVFDARGLVRLYEHSDAGYSHHATLRRHPLY